MQQQLYIFRKITKRATLASHFLRTSIALLIELSFYPKLSYMMLSGSTPRESR